MNRNTRIFCFLVLALAGLGGCSSDKSTTEPKKLATAPDKIRGKVQINLSESTAADAALNAGGSSAYLWEGTHRYRLFFKSSPGELSAGKEYIAEGVFAQKAIDEIGDPDQGKNGYPLSTSCERVVKTAWPGLSFDVTDGNASVLRARIKRYPARPVFLVKRLQLATAENGDSAGAKKDAEDEDSDVKEVSVPAEKQRALLIEGPTSQTAPLWEPAGGTVNCKVIINPTGKITELETGNQLCEAVPWSQFKYQPPVQGGHPVKVKTEVEVRFEPRK